MPNKICRNSSSSIYSSSILLENFVACSEEGMSWIDHDFSIRVVGVVCDYVIQNYSLNPTALLAWLLLWELTNM